MQHNRFIPLLLALPLLTVIFFNYSLNRYSAQYHLKEGLGFLKKDKHRRAEIHLQKAAEYNPDNKWLKYYLGVSQYRLEKFEESTETLGNLIQQDPNFLQVHYWLGNNYYRTKKFDKAREAYRESLRVNEIYGPAYYALGLIYLRERERFRRHFRTLNVPTCWKEI